MRNWSRNLTVVSVLIWVVIAGWSTWRQFTERVDEVIQERKTAGAQAARNIALHIEASVGNFRNLPNLLAQEPLVLAVLNSRQTNAIPQPPEDPPIAGETQPQPQPLRSHLEDLDDYLARIKSTLRPDEVWLMDAAGLCVAASNSRETNSPVGLDLSGRDYFHEAKEAHEAGLYSFGRRTHEPGLFFAAAVTNQGQFAGVVAVKMKVDSLTNWLDEPGAFVVDGYGVVVLANNPELPMRALPGSSVEHLTPLRRLERYHQTNFTELVIQPWTRPWAAANDGPLYLFNRESPPQLMLRHSVRRTGLEVCIAEPCANLNALLGASLWHFVLLATAGGSLLLLLGAGWQYNQEQRHINRILLSQKNLLTEAERIAGLGSWTYNLANQSLGLSDQAVEILKLGQAPSAPTLDIFAGQAAAEDRERVQNALQQAIRLGEPCSVEYNLHSSAGGTAIVHLQSRVDRDGQDRPVRLLGTVQDVTARKQAEAELTQSVSLLQATLESTADGILVVDRSGRVTSHNDRFLKMWQLPADIVAARNDEMLLQAVLGQLKDPAAVLARIQELYAQPLAESFDLIEFKDGKIFERYSKPQMMAGQPVGRVWSFYDVTEQTRAEAELSETERRMRILIEATMDIILLKDGEGRWQMLNQAARKAFSLGNLDYQGKTADELAVLVPHRKEDFEFAKDSDLHIWNNYRPSRAEEYLKDDEGHVRCYDMIKVPIYNEDASRQGLVVIGRDITDRKRTEAELFASRETFKTVLNNIPHLVFWKDLNLVFQGCNLAMAIDRGFAEPSSLIGKTDFDLDAPAEAESLRAVDREVIETNRPKLNYERTQVNADGTVNYFVVNNVPLHDKEGRVVGVLGVCENITERKLLEVQVRHAQKMESIGRLAGGVAHDFNNLLTVICGYAEILLEIEPAESPRRDALVEIKKAGDRAAALTRQLLAYSRKQILEPTILDLNLLLQDYEKMFSRLLGENVEVSLRLSEGLHKIRADPSHIDQVLLNLVVNARDAMPDGGKLSIETDNVELREADLQPPETVNPGRYVCLTVRDTGCGMDEKTMTHIFEPFFTTKAIGKGTGLGLAMIFGFIKQSGGHISVKSEVGVGTTFRIYLPEFIEKTD